MFGSNGWARGLAALAIGLALAGSATAGTFYKWVDERGVVHYSAKKPAGQTTGATAVRVKPTPAAPKPVAAPQPAAASAPGEVPVDPKWATCSGPICARAKALEAPPCAALCQAAIALARTCKEKARVVCVDQSNRLRARLDGAEAAAASKQIEASARSTAEAMRKASNSVDRDRAATQFLKSCEALGKSADDCRRYLGKV